MTETSVPDDHKRRVVADFNAMAETYDALRFVQVCARRLVELAALPPGAQVLDIATGTGWAAIAAAQHVGPTGRVLGVDLAPELLERARQKVAAAGLTQVEFREGDAERLDLGDQRLAEPETCRRLLHEAGFVQTEGQSEQLGYYFRTVEEYGEEMWSSRSRMAVLQLAPAQREQFKAEPLAAVGALATDQGIWRDVATNFARGWKRTT